MQIELESPNSFSICSLRLSSHHVLSWVPTRGPLNAVTGCRKPDVHEGYTPAPLLQWTGCDLGALLLSLSAHAPPNP